jgi:hypothetical protein
MQFEIFGYIVGTSYAGFVALILLVAGMGYSIVNYFVKRGKTESLFHIIEPSEHKREVEAIEFTLRFKWMKEDVIPIERLHYVENPRMRFFFILLLVLFSLLFIAVLALSFTYQSPGESKLIAWGAIVVVGAIFAGVPAFYYFIFIPLRFQLDSYWRHEFLLHFYKDKLRFTVAEGRGGIVELKWSSVNRIIQNERAYGLQLGPRRQDFFIVPKRIFGTRQQEEFFKDALKRANSEER